MRQLSLAQINRLATRPKQQGRMAGVARPDGGHPFVPEEHTQLYYTPLYRTLTDAQRLRYNQLFGLRLNEYIMMLEAELIVRLVAPLRRHPRVRDDAAMQQAIDTLIAEEQRHHAGFAAFNRACRPDLYPPGEDRCFSRQPWWTRAMFSVVGAAAAQLPFALWYMMAMEESALSLARDMHRRPQTETLGPLCPAFAALHHEHLKDEARHVHLDALLIERCMNPRHGALNARLFMAMLPGVVRPTRSGSGVRVIRQLVRDEPALAPREEALIRAVLDLKDDRRFQASLFNRRQMPRTFAIFDATPALAGLASSLAGYDRRTPA